MKALVLGCGSIGARHARNLCSLGVDVAVADVDERRAIALAEQIDGRALPTVGAGAAPHGADVVVVATPTADHVDNLEWALESGAAGVFVEKPLASTRDGLERARRLLDGAHAHTPVMVGCNLRFTEGYRQLRSRLDDIGGVHALLVDFGWWLPAWRPDQDYRLQYSARRRLGGGVILDAIHEIDYTLDLAGPADDIRCHWSRSGALEIDVEDVADIGMRHRSGIQSAIHLDYLRRSYARSCTVIGSGATLRWDVARGRVELADEPGGDVEVLADGLDADRNCMYVDELRHFLGAVEQGTGPLNGLSAAAATTAVALTALELGAPG